LLVSNSIKTQTDGRTVSLSIVSVRRVHPIGGSIVMLYRNLRVGLKIQDQPMNTQNLVS